MAIVLTATRKQTQLRQAAHLSGVEDRSFVPNQLGFEQASVTVQEYAVPKLEIQESPATFGGVRAAAAMRLEEILHVAGFDESPFRHAPVRKDG
jgi:hypothetical protein